MKQKSEGPDYYQRGNIEVWDFIRDQSLNYHLGNVIKYVCRAGYKDNDLKDLKKLPIIYSMKSKIEPNQIARTGRVQQWIDNPTNRLPVSCTIFNVQDSMEGTDGIEASWRFVSHALRYGAGVAVHLSELRPKGTTTNKGPDSLVASGPVSFGKIYSTLNEILRRGGTYRNGAVVLHLDINHPDILEFVQAERAELPWVKRCVDLTPEWWSNTETGTKEAILRGIARGDIWLNKVKHDRKGNRTEATFAWRFICPHVERASSSISIFQPVVSATSDRLSVKACRSCAISMARQVLAQLESI